MRALSSVEDFSKCGKKRESRRGDGLDRAPRIWRCWGQQEEEGEAGEGGSAEGAY